MELDDPRWVDKWSHCPYRAIVSDFPDKISAYAASIGFGLFGTTEEPNSSLWLASLSEPLGERFRNGMKVLDYGCGGGRYANFLSERLEDFQYFGVEKRNSGYGHGEGAIKAARKLYGQDPRVQFGFTRTRFEAKAVGTADIVVLGSVITHVAIDEAGRIFDTVAPVAGRGGVIVFSAFMADAYRLEGRGSYGFVDCYERAYYTGEQLRDLCSERNLTFVEEEGFLAQHVNMHHIFLVTR
jgi:SAM-dependent methyltransferase